MPSDPIRLVSWQFEGQTFSRGLLALSKQFFSEPTTVQMGQFAA